jgi:uncharacterized membrane protein/mono/diheme cytochrome c family protein
MRKLVVITVFAVFMVFILAACSSKDISYQYSDLPPGDAASGAALFTQSVNGAPACSSCHTLTGGQGTGPSLQDFAQVAGSRVKGQSAETYAFYSILRPSKHLVQGFSNLMPSDYENKLSRQQTADLISYLLTLGANGTAQASSKGNNSVDAFMIIFRLIHIFAAIIWVGSSIFILAFVQPAVAALGPDGQRFMQSLYRNTRFMIAFPLSSLLTVIAGLALYYRISDHFNADWMGSTAGIVLSIGALAGLAAFFHGAAALSPMTRRTGALMAEIAQQGTPPTQEQIALMRSLGSRTRTQGLVSIGLMIIAIVGMVSARYL